MHHTLDTKPVPEKVFYINEPDLADTSINYFGCGKQEEESQADHIRVYVPLDLSADAILRRLRFLVCRYGEANERNEFNFSMDVYTRVRPLCEQEQPPVGGQWNRKLLHSESDEDSGRRTGDGQLEFEQQQRGTGNAERSCDSEGRRNSHYYRKCRKWAVGNLHNQCGEHAINDVAGRREGH